MDAIGIEHGPYDLEFVSDEFGMPFEDMEISLTDQYNTV